MARKKKRGNRAVADALPSADWLPPESSPSRYYSRLVFADNARGDGPLGIVGQELQLVWYATERNRQRDRNGKLVAVLEFRDCRPSRQGRSLRYQFTGLLLEELSGEYREWLGHQRHRGRPFGEETQVLETEVRFCVAARDGLESDFGAPVPPTQPFFLEHPDVEELSSPQLDMLFDVMSFLYQNIPAMRLMEELRTQEVAEVAG
jgi:hypothetical protein